MSKSINKFTEHQGNSPKLKTQSIIKNLKKSRFNTRMFRNRNVPDLAQVFLNQ